MKMTQILNFGILMVLFDIIFLVICIEKKVFRIDTKPKVAKQCHLKSLDQCLNKAYYFTHHLNGTDLASDEKEFDNMCGAVIKVITCMDKYFDRCSYPVHKQVYQLGKEQFYQSWRQMCIEGPVRENYVKHSKCIQQTVRDSNHYKNVCINNLQNAFDRTTASNNVLDMINIGCCAFNQWQDCIDDLVQQKCGSDGKQAIKSLIEKASGGIIYNLCSKDYFDSESQICGQILSSRSGSNDSN